jgi:catechol 2,3-dioxygenase-like lactoylglutathione lyase family enzyme
MPTISAIHHVSVTVTDIDRSVAWYGEVLGLERLMEEKHPDGGGYAIVLGKPDWSMCIGIHTHDANTAERFHEARTGLDHVGLLVPSKADLEAWEARLTELGVEHAPINDELEGFAVLVFRDPDNIQLEFVSMG